MCFFSSSSPLFFLCSKEEKVLGMEKAPGSCPYCGGAVSATDVERSYRLFCLPLCIVTKRKYACAACSRRLVTYP
ncbi:uncharacterized protein LOC109725172 [Ananas comosus]|uniref:Uncharacterized protein LOC109725172 n=1 Tax=Ananas comosus TaxID=4615 RepID=A0A199VIQ5_ANACO|nr:uncharacterized protein LOC109725172 [Ananas comosus]OAY77032.1 hypothetical protein ACMD2_07215 [Ananas comosus]